MDQHDPFKTLGADELGHGGSAAAHHAGTVRFEPLPVPPGLTPPFEHPKLGRPSWQWEYHGTDGISQGDVCRFETATGKTFRPLRYGRLYEQIGWRWQGWGDNRPLYHVLDMLAQPTALVLVVEGEKKVHAAERMFPGGLGCDPERTRRLVAVAAMGGAYSPHKTDWSVVAGRDVVVWPDNDEPGAVFARAVADLALVAGAASVKIVEVPEGAPEGWDLADPLRSD